VQPAAPAEERPREQAPSVRVRRTYTRLRPRFGIAYLLLAVVVGTAVGGLVVYLGNRDTSGGAEWSTWKPTLHGQASWKQIAEHVEPRYRLPTGKQIVGIITGQPQIQDIPISHVAISSGLPDERREDIQIYTIKNGAMFILCGLGTSCAVPGKPSQARAQVLRREALELALYTFKYQSNVDAVLAFIPPPAGVNPTPQRMIFFRRDDLEQQLSEPLGATISPNVTVSPGKLLPREAAAIDRLTNPHFYKYDFQQLPDGSALAALTPPGS
jgi:hypothetical protein